MEPSDKAVTAVGGTEVGGAGGIGVGISGDKSPARGLQRKRITPAAVHGIVRIIKVNGLY
jgi:hypothetical protein